MKILFATYSLAFQNPGGGERVLLALRQELQALGHRVDLYDPWLHDPAEYELVHYFSCVENSFWEVVKESAPHVRLIVTPTLFISDDLKAPQSRLKRKITRFLSKSSDSPATQFSRFALPDFWLPTTFSELKGLETAFGIQNDRMKVLPNGIHPAFLEKAEPELFRKNYEIEGDFVLHVGRFHPVKNQLRLMEATEKAEFNAVFIGSPDAEHSAYYRQCISRASTSKVKIRIIPAMTQDNPLLASAYLAASVFALPSEFETFGIAALEAAVAGCSLVLTQKIKSGEIFKEIAYFVEPDSTDEIVEGLKEAMSNPPSDGDLSIRKRLALIYSWPKIAKDLEQIYFSLKP